MHHYSIDHPSGNKKLIYAPCGRNYWGWESSDYHVFETFPQFVNCPKCLNYLNGLSDDTKRN